MALENYTKFQKMMLLALVVLGAVLFTVTGTMMAVAEGCGREGGTSRIAGSINGEEITRELFQARSTAMGWFSDVQVPVLPDESLSKQLLINNIIEGSAPYYGQPSFQGTGYSLFSLWPRKHDQHVWLYSILIERAKAAGYSVPPIAAAAEFYFKAVSPDRVMDEAARRKHFEETGRDPNITLRAIGEGLMVRDYVSAIVSKHTATNEEMMSAYNARASEQSASIYRLDASRFNAQAKAEIEAAESASAAGRAASALSGAGGFGSPLTPSARLNRFPTPAESRVLQDELTVAFDMIAAEPKDLASSIPTPSQEELKSFFSNIRGQSFRASQADTTPERIEERFKFVVDREREILAAEPSEDWKKTAKEDLKWFYDYHERSDAVIEQLKLSNAQSLARAAIEVINLELEDQRKDAKAVLDAEVATIRERKAISDGRLSVLNGIKDQLKSLADAPVEELNRLLDTWKATTGNEANAANNIFGGLQAAFTRTSGNSVIAKATGLRRHVSVDQDANAVRNKEVELEDLLDLQRRTPPGDKDYDAKEQPNRVRISLEAAKARQEEGLMYHDKLGVLASKIEAYAAEVELRAMTAQHSPNGAEALRQLCRELAFEWPVLVKTWTDGIIPEGRAEELTAISALVERDITRAQTNSDRKSKDQSSLSFSNMVRGVKVGRGMTVDLRYDTGVQTDEAMTMREIARSRDYFWIDTVNDAKSFLNNADNPDGAVSQVLHRPGFGYYLIRLRTNNEKVEIAASEQGEQANALAIARRAREIAKAEAAEIRVAADRSGNAKAYLDDLVTKGIMTKTDTDWFVWGGNVKGLRLVPDPDADSATGLDDNRPSANFFNALKAVGPTSKVSLPFLEGEIDWANRSAGGRYEWSLAVVTGQRKAANPRVPTEAYELANISAEGIVLVPRYAADKDILTLVDPGLLSQGFKVSYDLGQYTERENKKKTTEEPAKPTAPATK